MATDFGKDVSCTDALHTGRYVTGNRLVAEALYRRLTTPPRVLRGGEEEDDYGFDLTAAIGSAVTKSDAAALEGQISAEAQKDERIQTCKATVTRIVNGPSVEFSILIECTTALGPFALTLGVDDVSAELLGVAA